MGELMGVIPGPTDATSFYRAIGPLGALRQTNDVRLVVPAEANWANVKACTALFMQRPFTPAHHFVLKTALRCSRKIWVDYDDDLFSVPPSNPTHRQYSDKQSQLNVTNALCYADVVSVSTPALQTKFCQVLENMRGAEGVDRTGMKLNGAKIMLIPNAYDTDCFRDLATATLPQPRKLVIWRGSNTHDDDLWQFTPEICRTIANHLDWNFTFVGDPFWMTMQEIREVPGVVPGKNVLRQPSLDVLEYLHLLYETRPALMIVPLADTPFNRAKSNIVWLEGLHAGAVTLAPDWPEWQRPGVINYKDPADFGDKFDRFLRGEYDGPVLWAQGRNFVREHLLLPKVNRLREVILQGLFAPGPY